MASSVSPKHPSARRPKGLQTTDLDELKGWIGLDDRAVKGRCRVEHAQGGEMRELLRLHKEVVGDKVPRGQRAFASRVKASTNAGAKLEAVRSHARSYLFGDSSLIREAKPVIESFFESFEILVWVLPKITVTNAGRGLARAAG